MKCSVPPPTCVDPTVVYSNYFGGLGVDQANAIAVDAAGNAYVVGVVFLAAITRH